MMNSLQMLTLTDTSFEYPFLTTGDKKTILFILLCSSFFMKEAETINTVYTIRGIQGEKQYELMRQVLEHVLQAGYALRTGQEAVLNSCIECLSGRTWVEKVRLDGSLYIETGRGVNFITLSITTSQNQDRWHEDLTRTIDTYCVRNDISNVTRKHTDPRRPRRYHVK